MRISDWSSDVCSSDLSRCTGSRIPRPWPAAPRPGWSPSCSPLEGTRLAPKGFADRLIACVAMGIIASPSRKPEFPIGEGEISTPPGRRAMDEHKIPGEDKVEGGPVFDAKKILTALGVNEYGRSEG